MAHIHCIIDCILPVFIDQVNIYTLFNQKLTKFDFTILSSVEKASLFQSVQLAHINTKFTEVFEHGYCFLFVLNLDSSEDQILFELSIGSHHISNFKIILWVFLRQFINIASFYYFKNYVTDVLRNYST